MSTSSSRFVLDAFGGPEVMRLEAAPIPAAEPGTVVVAVEAVGVNFADTMVRRGEYLRNQPLSMAPGCEAVGRVVAAGPGAGIEVGARVAAFVEAGGCYAEHVLAPAEWAFPVPEEISAAEIAAVFLQGTTAHYSLHLYGRVAAGETVLVHAAAGGVGGIAVQLARLAGARVIGTASTAEKRAIVLQTGADAVLDSSDPGGLEAAVRSASGGSGVDVVVDGVGGPLFAPSLAALAFNGRYVLAGSASQQPAELDARRLLVRGQTVSGFVLVRVAELDAGEPARTLGALCALVGEGSLRPRVEALPLERAPEAHRRLEERRVCGKIVLIPGDA